MTYGGTPPTITPALGLRQRRLRVVAGPSPTCSTTASSSSPARRALTRHRARELPTRTTTSATLRGGDGQPGPLIDHRRRAAPMTYGATRRRTPPGTRASLTANPRRPHQQPTCTTAATSASPVLALPPARRAAAPPTPTTRSATSEGSVTVDPTRDDHAPRRRAMTYGGTAPTITAERLGPVNGPTRCPRPPLPTCSTTATSSSPVDVSYPTSCRDAAGPNYTISYETGHVTVDPATLSVTASSPTMTYGGTCRRSRQLLGLRQRRHRGLARARSRPARPLPRARARPGTPYPSTCSGADGLRTTRSATRRAPSRSPGPAGRSPRRTATMTYGGPRRPSPHLSGFVNGDTAASLTTQPTCSTTATSSSPP